MRALGGFRVGQRVVIPRAPWMDEVTRATRAYADHLPDRNVLAGATGVVEQCAFEAGTCMTIRLDNSDRWPVNPIYLGPDAVRARPILRATPNGRTPSDGHGGMGGTS